MLIRSLHPLDDLAAVTDFQAEAQDYWLLAEGKCDPAAKAVAFFTDGPPGCDPAISHRLGLFANGVLSGLAEVSFDFPEAGDAYLGLMLIAPSLRSQGAGSMFLAEVERLARLAGSPVLYLAVLEANPRGWAFWERMGFAATGKSRRDDETGHVLHRLVKVL